jgi:ATP-binding cassette subfamily B protein
MLFRFTQSQASLGDLVLFYQVFAQAKNLMRSLLENIAQIYSNGLFLGNLFDFLDLESQVHDPLQAILPPKVIQHGNVFRQVDFQYPRSPRIALQALELTITAGQIAAIVGPNGAGKNTFKLLCRLYDPTRGDITIDGIDIRQMPIVDLRQKIAVLPQEFARYNAKVSENIALADPTHHATDSQIQFAAHAAQADQFIERLPLRYDSILGRWFENGAELSTGEWQRIALARVWMRDAPIIILDEPTSSMDPWTEVAWLTDLRHVVEGRIAIIITHRISTAMHCDIIHVLEEGHILESGNHQQLLHRQGRYAQLWQTQQ